MSALRSAGLSERVYLWSDDNLSTDFVFTELTAKERELLGQYPHYGRVCCFKGFDAAAFTFNTGAAPSGFDRQFELFARYLELGVDLYAYVTLTGPSLEAVPDGIWTFMNRLQTVSRQLPLRVVPLQITAFGPMLRRAVTADREVAFAVQEAAIAEWRTALATRFSAAELRQAITEVVL
jgi:hypothetical protein